MKINDYIKKGKPITQEALYNLSIPINDAVEKVLAKHGFIKQVDPPSDNLKDINLVNEFHDEIQKVLEVQFDYPEYDNYN